ncbi:RNA polymerase sigma factor [Dyadobacter endophyticus]|uniref:DNA-directed RNA polymerase sigma-70 factor n=1 Tax=Dyadobacter endophyticus TaxID=1749036 RepID=A0ABQ1YPY0_9BACT|nr:sigma-70 family RNA polymerase sigma factor [Dyadobacter endophyticus]GGH32163.1 DNA-directed RNA polymerase sigma-70 factor [Dyadobacter endophyticus]
MNTLEKATDDELATLLTDGSEAAFDSIYERYWRKLYNEAFKRINDSSDSEEIVQDIFVDLWHKRASRRIENLRGYLLGAVRYQVFAVYHKRKNLPAFEEPLDYMAFSTDNADSNFLRDELLTSIHQWLETQPEKRREIFRLRFLEGLSTIEIAEQLDISRKTVQNQLNTSQQSLRESIGRLLIVIILLLRP